MNLLMEQGHRRQQALLRLLFDPAHSGELAEGKLAKNFSMQKFATANKIHESVMYKRLPVLKDLKILRKEGPVFGTKENGLSAGRHFDYQLMMNEDEAMSTLVDWQAEALVTNSKNRSEGAKKGAAKRNAKAKREDKPVYIATEDHTDAPVLLVDRVDAQTKEKLRELRKDEPRALVEATRQYLANKQSTAIPANIDSLEREAERLGLTFNREDFLKLFPDFAPAMTEEDPMFEAIALVLPYIDALERRAGLAEVFETTHSGIASTH